MKRFLLIFVLLFSCAHFRRHIDDLYELEELLKDKHERHSSRLNSEDLLSLFEPEEDFQQSSEENESNENERLDEKTTSTTSSPREKNSSTIGTSSKCLNQYETKPDSLVKVKYLNKEGRLIRYVSIEQPSISSELSLREICMLKCCAEPTCDLAMLSEQPATDVFKCYLFACNGTCPLASHDDYSVMIPKKKISDYNVKTTSQVMIDKKATVTRKSLLIVISVLISIIVVFLLIIGFCYCRKWQKLGRRGKNYSIDADYLINGLYL